LIVYWLIFFSFFPTIMFLSKFFFLFLFINHSLGWVFSLVIILVFIFQGFYIRSLMLSLIYILFFSFKFYSFYLLYYFNISYDNLNLLS
jgi:hypothetical protein